MGSLRTPCASGAGFTLRGEKWGEMGHRASVSPPSILPASLCSALTFEPGAPGKPGAPAGPTGPWGDRKVWGGCPGWGGSRRTPVGFSRILGCGVKAAPYLQGVQQGRGGRHCLEHPGGRWQLWGGGSQHPDPPPTALCHRATVTLTAAPEGPGRPRSPGSPRGPCHGGGGTVQRLWGLTPHSVPQFPFCPPPALTIGPGEPFSPGEPDSPYMRKRVERG